MIDTGSNKGTIREESHELPGGYWCHFYRKAANALHIIEFLLKSQRYGETYGKISLLAENRDGIGSMSKSILKETYVKSRLITVRSCQYAKHAFIKRDFNVRPRSP